MLESRLEHWGSIELKLLGEYQQVLQELKDVSVLIFAVGLPMKLSISE